MADTDSMAIVATPTGGLVPCPGGPHQLDGQPAIRALSYPHVEAIRGRFATLNPYDPDAIPGSILKVELDAYCYAIAAKRYALFRYDPDGRPRLVPAPEHEPCSHGLGHLLNPVDPDHDPEGADWITQLWEHELAQALTPDLAGPAPSWYGRPTLSRITATSPALLAPFAARNRGKPYREQVKPFNFLMFAPGAQPPAGTDEEVRLVAPYAKASRWPRLRWANLHLPGPDYQLSTDPAEPGAALCATHGANAARYLTHPEPKSADATGNPCARDTTGLLHRRHVHADSYTHIGKEANRLDERETGQLTATDLDEHQQEYGRSDDEWERAHLPRLRRIGSSRIRLQVEISDRRLRDILAGRATPRSALRRQLERPSWPV
jgi:hypothetical protein